MKKYSEKLRFGPFGLLTKAPKILNNDLLVDLTVSSETFSKLEKINGNLYIGPNARIIYFENLKEVTGDVVVEGQVNHFPVLEKIGGSFEVNGEVINASTLKTIGKNLEVSGRLIHASKLSSIKGDVEILGTVVHMNDLTSIGGDLNIEGEVVHMNNIKNIGGKITGAHKIHNRSEYCSYISNLEDILNK